MKKNQKDGEEKTLNLEDVPELKEVAEKITSHINQFEATMAERTEKLEIRIGKLENKNSENE